MPAATIGAVSKQLGFGPGFLVATGVNNNVGGAALDNLTPIRFGVLQSVNIDFDFKNKQLYSQRVFPLISSWSQGQVSGKIRSASICGWLANILLGFTTATPNTGSQVVMDSLQTIPSSPPYTVTITNASDLGVTYQLTSVTNGSISMQLTRVSASPNAGQYSFSAGTWTFAAGDAGKIIYVSYALAGDAGTANYSFVNPMQGLAPIFGLQFIQQFGGKTFRVSLPTVVSQKFSMPTRANDYEENEIDFEAVCLTDGAPIAVFDTLI
jgi:hypothetical protein